MGARPSQCLPESQVEPASPGHRMVAVFESIDAVVGEPRGAAPYHDVAMPQLYPCDLIVSSEAAEQEPGGKPQRDRYDRMGEVSLILVLMQAQLRGRRIAVDEACIGQKIFKAGGRGGAGCEVPEDRRHRPPPIAADRGLPRGTLAAPIPYPAHHP